MMRSKLWLTLIPIVLGLLLSGINSWAQASGRPSQSLTQQRNNEANKNESYSGQWVGTWTATNSPPSQARTDNQSSNSNKHPHALWKIWEWITSITAQHVTNSIIAIATVILAIFTGQLVCVTRDLHVATQTATKAAQQSARATEIALNAERPYLFLEEQRLVRSEDTLTSALTGAPIPPEYRKIYLGATFRLRNRGKGVAILRTAQVRLLAINGGIHRPTGKLRRSEVTQIGHYQARVKTQVISGGEATERAFVQSFALSPDQWDQARNLDLWLLLVVHVRYADVFKRIYPSRFMFDYEPHVTLAEIGMGEGLLTAFREDYTRYK